MAAAAHGFTGADLAALVHAAGMRCLQRSISHPTEPHRLQVGLCVSGVTLLMAADCRQRTWVFCP